jgi:WD40 repeat protein
MQKAVNTCDATVCILSPDFLTSDFTAAEWQVAFASSNWKEVAPLTGAVDSISFNPDGHYVATASERDDVAHVFTFPVGREVARLVQGSNTVAFSPDGRHVATGSWDGSARVFDAKTGKLLARLHHAGAVVAVAFSPNGRYLATGSKYGTARVFDAMKWQGVGPACPQRGRKCNCI